MPKDFTSGLGRYISLTSTEHTSLCEIPSKSTLLGANENIFIFSKTPTSFFKLSPESLIESWKAGKSRHIAHFLRIWNISKLKFWSLCLCFGSLCYSSVDLNPFSLHLSLLSSLYFSSAPAAGASLLSCAINFSNAFLFLLELAQSPSWCLTDFFPLKESSLSLQWTKFFRWCY